MDEGHRKIRIWLAVMVLAAVLAGCGYYYAAERGEKYESEDTLVEHVTNAGEDVYDC